MKYEFKSRIRYSETDSRSDLTWLSLLDHFQDCSVFQSESLGLGLKFLEQDKKAWVIVKWRILADRLPKLNDPVTIRTWAYDMKGFYGLRNFDLLDEKGQRLAFADTTWAYMSTETGKPVRIPKEVIQAYDPEERIEVLPCERKIHVPEEYVEEEGVKVPAYFIDSNHHVNNSRYAELALSFVPENFKVRELRIEYRSSAMLGDIICPRVTAEDKKITVNLTDEAGKTYAIAEMFGQVSE